LKLWRLSLRLIFPHSTPFALKYGKLKVVFFKIHPSFPHKAWKARAFFFIATVKLNYQKSRLDESALILLKFFALDKTVVLRSSVSLSTLSIL